MSDAFSKARAIAVTLLNSEALRSPEVIRAQVAKATSIIPGLTPDDTEALVAQLMHEASVFVPDATLMDDPIDHIEWLPARRGAIQEESGWRFWTRYKEYLEKEKGLPEPVVGAGGAPNYL